MFYKFYRLKQKKGAVLMLVVVVMSLLVIVASTAYYTARSAYKTVVSNYDFSQLYLSATSVSDMMLDAVANDTSVSSVNNFAGLKSAVLALTDKDSYIDLSDKATDSVQSGVLDNVNVRITLTGIEDVTDKLTGKDTGLDRYIYTFETFAEYRSNSIRVQDVIYNERGIKSDPPEFDTFFTATGQELTVDGEGNSNSAKTASRKVVINTKEISDDAYFENEVTVLYSGSSGNKLKGGLSTAGSLYVHTLNCDIAAPTIDIDDFGDGVTELEGERNDWVIGKDLVFYHSNGSLNLNGNNLFVGGDLIILNDQNYYADNIYVLGDVYLFGQAKINANLFVNGEIKRTDDGVLAAVEANCSSYGYYFSSNSNPRSYTPTDKVNGNSVVYMTDASKGLPTIYDGSDKFIFDGNTKNTTTGQYGNVYVQPWLNYGDTPVAIFNNEANEDNSAYIPTVTKTTLSTAFASKTQTSSYGNYTIGNDNVIKNELVIDFGSYDSNWQLNFTGATSVTSVGNVHTVTFESSKGDAATLIRDTTGNGTATIQLPYSATGGYALKLLNANSVQTHDYQFMTGASPMTVILLGNYKTEDNDTVDANGYNAFSWKGNPYSNSSYTHVELMPYDTQANGVGTFGSVVFELGNYEKATGTYCAYDASKSALYDSVVYYMDEMSVVGTRDQILQINNQVQSPDIFKTMLNGAKPLVDTVNKRDYNDKIILVSNKNNGIAIDATRQNAGFCGYIYAPNGVYRNTAATNDSVQIFGGMIVSTYELGMANYVYAEPIPSVIEDAFSALKESSVGNNLKLSSGVWYQSGSNYLG